MKYLLYFLVGIGIFNIISAIVFGTTSEMLGWLSATAMTLYSISLLKLK